MKTGLALLLLLAQAKTDDSSADELFKTMRAMIDQARTVHVETHTKVTQGGNPAYDMTSSFKLKGQDQWTWEYQWQVPASDGGQQMAAQCDGRKIVTRGMPNPELLRELKPADVGAAYAFLASDKASFATGANIVLDGGFTLRPLVLISQEQIRNMNL